jgi:hypothetical protein
MLAHPLGSTEVKGHGDQASTDVNSVDVGMTIAMALSRCGLSHKQACAYMEIDPGLWSRQLSGDGHVSFQRLLKLPVTFWRQFLPLIAEPAGLAVSHHDMADLALLQAAVAFDALVRGVTQMRLSLRRIA